MDVTIDRVQFGRWRNLVSSPLTLICKPACVNSFHFLKKSASQINPTKHPTAMIIYYPLYSLRKISRRCGKYVLDAGWLNFDSIAVYFLLPPFSLLRDFSFQNTSEHFAIRFHQSYLIWEVCDVTAIELSSKE